MGRHAEFGEQHAGFGMRCLGAVNRTDVIGATVSGQVVACFVGWESKWPVRMDTRRPPQPWHAQFGSHPDRRALRRHERTVQS